MTKSSLPKGPLTTPMPALTTGLLTDSELAQARIREHVALEQEKMTLLAEHYGIPDSPTRWYFVALELARQAVPGLQQEKPKGRPKKWGPFEQSILVVEIERLMGDGLTQEDATRKLATQKPWVGFVESWDADRSTTGSDPAAALLTAYKGGRTGWFVPITRDAYRFHEHEGSLDAWQAFVIESIEKRQTGKN